MVQFSWCSERREDDCIALSGVQPRVEPQFSPSVHQAAGSASLLAAEKHCPRLKQAVAPSHPPCQPGPVSLQGSAGSLNTLAFSVEQHTQVPLEVFSDIGFQSDCFIVGLFFFFTDISNASFGKEKNLVTTVCIYSPKVAFNF